MHQIDLTPIYAMANEALLTVLGGLALWLGSYAKQWLSAHAKFLGEQTDTQLAEGLNRALANGVQIAMQKAEDLEKQYPGVPVKSQIAAWAANYAVSHSPGAVQHFGMNPNDLAIKALAYLPSPAITDGTTGVTIPAPDRVEVTNMQPVK